MPRRRVCRPDTRPGSVAAEMPRARPAQLLHNVGSESDLPLNAANANAQGRELSCMSPIIRRFLAKSTAFRAAFPRRLLLFKAALVRPAVQDAQPFGFRPVR